MQQLGIKYNTDKVQHGFLEVYEKELSYLRHQKINILEIGIWDGGSLKMWKEYFPNSTIYGVDINNKAHLKEDRIHIDICDQSKPAQLASVFPGIQFDLIIDDGSHIINHQQITLKALFSKRLTQDGVYILEDLHTSLYTDNYTNTGCWYRTYKDNTTLTLLKNLKRGIPFITPVISKEDFSELYKAIESIDIFYLNDLDSITSVIRKV